MLVFLQVLNPAHQWNKPADHLLLTYVTKVTGKLRHMTLAAENG
jgi:hypothetical protein